MDINNLDDNLLRIITTHEDLVTDNNSCSLVYLCGLDNDEFSVNVLGNTESIRRVFLNSMMYDNKFADIIVGVCDTWNKHKSNM